jgi:hypothetical protein
MIQEYFLAQIWNGTQFFTADGTPLVGGKIATYSAGSMSLQAITYTDNTGTVANTNPIVLDSSGRIPQEIWLDVNASYQFVLYQPDGETVIMACDNIGTNDPYPSLIGNSGLFLATDGTDVYWDSPLPPLLSTPGYVLTVGEGGDEAVWAPAGGGSSAPTEFICELAGPYSLLANSVANEVWTAYPQQDSPDVSVNDNSGLYPTVFTINTEGSYKVTVTGRIRNTNYPEGYLTNEAMLYGIEAVGTYGNFSTSTHQSGQAIPTGWAPSNGFHLQCQWTDTFYVMKYDANPVTFTIGLYAGTADGLFDFNAACMVSILRTTGTPNQPA